MLIEISTLLINRVIVASKFSQLNYKIENQHFTFFCFLYYI